MKILIHKKEIFLLLSTLVSTLLFTSCSNDDDNEVILDEPIIENVEIGTGNNEIGVVAGTELVMSGSKYYSEMERRISMNGPIKYYGMNTRG